MDKKVTSIVGYIGLIGWIIAFCAGDKEGAKFHLNQALVIMIFQLVPLVTTVLAVIPILGWILAIAGWLWSIFMVVCWVMGLIYAIQGEEKTVPVVGNIKILK